MKLVLGSNFLCVLPGYTPRSRLTVEDKTMFCDNLLATSGRMMIVVSFLHALTLKEVLEPMKLVMKG